MLARHYRVEAEQIGSWPIREGLLAFLGLLRDRALESFRHRQVLWALGVKFDTPGAPELPAILREDDGDR